MSSWGRNTIERCFGDFDEGGKGWLSKEDLKVAMTALFGFRPTKYEVNRILSAAKESSDGAVTLDFFANCMLEKLRGHDEEDEIRQMYMAFDVGCRGFLTLKDAVSVFKEVAPWVPLRTVEVAFSVADKNGDGRVGFAEFTRVMRDGGCPDSYGVPRASASERSRMIPNLFGIGAK